MSNACGCFYVDGSFLFASIERVKRDHTELESSKLNIGKLSSKLIDGFFDNFSSSLRVVYYFRKDDSRIKKLLTVPSLHGDTGHWQIKQCGQNIKGHKSIPSKELDKLSEEYRDIFPRAEKGLDMELACDALLLAAGSNVNCFVFMVNDRDYLPLLNSIQRLGANTYIAGLDIRQKVQNDLLNFADRYITLEQFLYDIFDYTPPVKETSET